MSPQRVSDLDRARRRREVAIAAATVTVTWILLVTLYYALPIRRHAHADAWAFFRLIVATVFFAAALAWQTRRILKAELPELRAVEALGVAIPLFLVLFASIYLTFARSSVGNFSEPLNHTRALYFTVSVFSTVGFGDITPTTDPARVMVAIQMLLDLVIIGVVVRMLFDAARHGLMETSHAIEADDEAAT